MRNRQSHCLWCCAVARTLSTLVITGSLLSPIAPNLLAPSFAEERLGPQQVFNDDAILAAAVANIASMSKDELDAFANFLASCSDDRDNELVQHGCGVAREKYRIEFERGRPLDRLINSLEVTVMYFNSSEKVGRRVDGNAIKRLVDIQITLKQAANSAFEAYRNRKKSN